MTAPGNAGGVFLSYASQDGDAAHRICDALRAAGIEVWLDQNELRGGDAWDQRIRRQVRECVLFVPVISSQTQSRKEGYFRLEWRLAVERMHRMSDGATFLVPVVIDKMSERSADVPEVFKSVQWARLPGGDTPRQFVDLILSLIESAKPDAAEDSTTHAAAPSVSSPTSVRRKSRSARWLAMAVALLVAVGVATYSWLRPITTPAPKPSIAVLPFDNFGGGPAAERLADGITEDIITDLARFQAIEVIARNSTMAYKGAPADVRQVGRDLDVRYVLEGSIQHQDDQVRVTAQLIDAVTGAHVWSERWDRSSADVFAIQTEIAETVATRLGDYSGMIAVADLQTAKRKRPSDLDAYDLYLLGSEALDRETEDGTDEAIRLLKRSIEIDPTFARAWSALSSAYDTTVRWPDKFAEEERQKLTLAAARRAVSLDPTDAEAHVALAFALSPVGDFAQTEAEFDKALSLNPNSAEILASYAQFASKFGKPLAGAEAADRSIRLSPNMPAWIITNYRIAYFMAGRYEDVLRVISRRPREVFIRWDYVMYAASLTALGRAEEARTIVAEAMKRYPDISIEVYLGTPNAWTSDQQSYLLDKLSNVGFPICADEIALKQTPDLVRLPQCRERN